MKRSKSTICDVEVAQLDGEGDFSCPICGITISPNDETKRVYEIVDCKFRGQSLDKLVVRCNNCRSKIQLVGFRQFTQACSCVVTKAVLFWICANKILPKN